MPVAGHQVAAGLGDADYRLARAQLLRRDPVVHEALEVERSLVDAVGIVEPVARAEPDSISSHGRSLLSSRGLLSFRLRYRRRRSGRFSERLYLRRQDGELRDVGPRGEGREEEAGGGQVLGIEAAFPV